MYTRIFEAHQRLTKGDQASLNRCNYKNIIDSPAYFRVLKMSGCNDNKQSARVLYLLCGMDIVEDGSSVAESMVAADIKERQIIQIVRGGEDANAIEYLKRQLKRCSNISLKSLGELAQYWGENTKRNLLKQFILAKEI